MTKVKLTFADTSKLTRRDALFCWFR